jgi:hypothetical protein
LPPAPVSRSPPRDAIQGPESAGGADMQPPRIRVVHAGVLLPPPCPLLDTAVETHQVPQQRDGSSHDIRTVSTHQAQQIRRLPDPVPGRIASPPPPHTRLSA